MEENNSGTAQAVATSSSTTTASAATDPFQFLAQHIQRRVAITLLPRDATDTHDGGAVVSGTLLGVDDLCNVLVSSWICTEAPGTSSVSGVSSSHRNQHQPQPRKRTRTEAAIEEGESLRLIRGAQIASISLLA